MKKALILIEYQNEWLSPSGSLYPIIENKLKEKNVNQNTLELIAIARKKKYSIIHVPLLYKNNYIEINDRCEGLVKAVKENNRFNSHSEKSEIYKCFTPKEKDIIISGRVGTSGFSGSNLDNILRSADIEELYFAGFITEVCVLSTLIDAYNRGYRCRLLTDCTLSPDDNAQLYTENIVTKHFGKVLRNTDFMTI